ncbi:MAG: hypothetical protein DKM50_05390, partial [Candidatus Margulisiibacteriota bacterium]
MGTGVRTEQGLILKINRTQKRKSGAKPRYLFIKFIRQFGVAEKNGLYIKDGGIPDKILVNQTISRKEFPYGNNSRST